METTIMSQRDAQKKRDYEEMDSQGLSDLGSRWTDFDDPVGWYFDYDSKKKYHEHPLLPVLTPEKIEKYPHVGIVQGRPLLEVFSVCIEHNDANIRRLYGTIEASQSYTSLYTMKMWERARGDPVSIKPRKSTPLLLNGPLKCFSAYDPFAIFLNIIDQGTDEKFNDVICCQCFEDRDFDERKSETVCCGNLSVTVNYVVFRWGVPATVEVTLKKPQASTDVRGWVTARSTCFEEEEGWLSVLFKERELVPTKNQVVPLTRATVAIPLDSNLRVRAELHDGDGRQIAHGQVDFPVISFGIFERKIPGEHGEICVKVTWKLYSVIRGPSQSTDAIPSTLNSDAITRT